MTDGVLTRDEAKHEIREKVASWRTICEVHREIYDIAEDLPFGLREKMQDLIIESFIMAKKMNEKLRAYKSDWDAGLWVENDLANRSPRRINIVRRNTIIKGQM